MTKEEEDDDAPATKRGSTSTEDDDDVEVKSRRPRGKKGKQQRSESADSTEGVPATEEEPTNRLSPKTPEELFEDSECTAPLLLIWVSLLILKETFWSRTRTIIQMRRKRWSCKHNYLNYLKSLLLLLHLLDQPQVSAFRISFFPSFYFSSSLIDS